MNTRLISNTVWALLLFCCTSGTADAAGNRHVTVNIMSEQSQKVSPNEVHFSLKVANTDMRAYVLGTNLGKPQPYPVYLEQLRPDGRWRVVAPCVDVPPPGVVSLRPNQVLALDFTLTVPLPSTCKERTVKFEGKFRYRIEYFSSRHEAQTYLDQMFAPGHRPPRAAVSEPFEIK